MRKMGTNCSLKNSVIRPFIFYLRACLSLIESQVWEKKKETILKRVQGMALSLVLDGPATKKLASLYRSSVIFAPSTIWSTKQK